MKTMTDATLAQTAWPYANTGCSLCGSQLSPRGGHRDGDAYEKALAEHCEWNHFTPEVGDFLSYVMVTDTNVYEVVDVSKTGKTIKVRTTHRGRLVRTDGGTYPIVDHEAVSDPTGTVYTVRLRKDKTWRLADYARMHPATMIDGVPTMHTNYTF